MTKAKMSMGAEELLFPALWNENNPRNGTVGHGPFHFVFQEPPHNASITLPSCNTG